MFRFQYELTDEDYYAYSLHHLYAVPENKNQHTIRKTAFPTICLFLGAFLSVARQSWFYLILFSIASIAWLFCYDWQVRRNLRKRIVWLKKYGKLPSIERTAITFEEDAFTSITDHTEMRSSYAMTERIFEGDSAFYLYQSVITAVILPYRAFASDEERAAFGAFIREKAPKKEKKPESA